MGRDLFHITVITSTTAMEFFIPIPILIMCLCVLDNLMGISLSSRLVEWGKWGR
jgi:hypothetical protein